MSVCLNLNGWDLHLCVQRNNDAVCTCMYVSTSMCTCTLAARVSFFLFPAHMIRGTESLCTSMPLSPVTLGSIRTSTECMSEGEKDLGRKAGLMLARCTTLSEYPGLGAVLVPHRASVSSRVTKRFMHSILPYFASFTF